MKETLTTNTALKSLNLSKTNLNTEAAIILAEGLPFFKGINAIDMTLNPLDAAGLLAISVSLKLNQSVSKLELLPFLAPAPVFNLDAIFSPIITSLFNYSPVQPEKLSQKQEEEKQEELGKYLNDIEIYCRRNKEIIKRQDIVGEEGSETSLSDSHTSLTIPIEADYTDLFKFLEECKNVAELFLELQESNSDIAQVKFIKYSIYGQRL